MYAAEALTTLGRLPEALQHLHTDVASADMVLGPATQPSSAKVGSHFAPADG